MNILVADDDLELCQLLTEFLTSEGFDITTSNDGQQALKQAMAGDVDAVVLDVMMPLLGGFDVLRELRKVSTVPVIMLTAHGEDMDRILGLELGADDYLPKPFNPRELSARLRAILRRVQNIDESLNPIEIDDLVLSHSRRQVSVGGKEIILTGTEFGVLEILLSPPGELVSKADLCQRALGRPLERYDRSIDMHVSNLRKKLGMLPNSQTRIQSVRGQGYLYVRL